MAKQALVTTGATVTFEALLRSVLRERFLDTLAGYGYGRVVVQYGRAAGATALVKTLLHALGGRAKVVREGEAPATGHRIDVAYGEGDGGILVECIQFDVRLCEKYTRGSALVVSHAGTGSIIDTLRATTPPPALVVVVNEALQDNHQREIAQAFETLGVVRAVSGGDDEALLAAVAGIEQQRQTEETQRRTLAAARGAVVETVLAEELL